MFAAFQLLVFERQGTLTLLEDPLIKQHADRIHLLPLAGNLDHVSSTRVRRLAGAGEPINELVPAEVASFIAEHRMYQEFADR
jgi:nicotinic acid mononucleotide adenylyltransferase